jgi:hypothetical protein
MKHRSLVSESLSERTTVRCVAYFPWSVMDAVRVESEFDNEMVEDHRRRTGHGQILHLYYHSRRECVACPIRLFRTRPLRFYNQPASSSDNTRMGRSEDARLISTRSIFGWKVTSCSSDKWLARDHISGWC